MAPVWDAQVTTPARPGLPLPLELVIEIVKLCEDYNWPYKDKDPHYEYHGVRAAPENIY